ncbi:beta-1,3-galactosyltransferase 1-like [Saccostrea echinata]|uniref:beta-1,3-galactosyltransferase 1-like n=1 Tax=Saccostrea echinata TaxID=191078 RepID=UPI002A824B04|nr:beta-1,3-galactosyltransferase 1-like [Saccostrea echinata]
MQFVNNPKYVARLTSTDQQNCMNQPKSMNVQKPRDKQKPINQSKPVNMNELLLINKPTFMNQSKSMKKIDLLSSKKHGFIRPDECDACFVHNYSYILDNEDICSTDGNKNVSHILILITSTPENSERRAAIRDTWLSPSRENTADVRYAFLVGMTSDMILQKKLEMEYLSNRDLIQEDFVDSYYNLTLKTLMAFKWASTKCKEAKYFFKTDDDMFVNLDALKEIIKKNERILQKSIAGRCDLNRKPIRNIASKWYISYENYPHKQYPIHCSGTGYVTSMNIVNKVYKISRNIPFIFLEDIFVSLCIRKLGLNMTNLEGFNTGLVKPGCIYKTKEVVTSHRVSPELLRKIWNECFHEAKIKA